MSKKKKYYETCPKYETTALQTAKYFKPEMTSNFQYPNQLWLTE